VATAKHPSGFHTDKSTSNFEDFGHTGKYHGIFEITSQSYASQRASASNPAFAGTGSAYFNFTGSDNGYGAMVFGTTGTNGTASLSGGGEVLFGALTSGTIYNFSISKIELSAPPTTPIYVLKTQGV